MRQSWRRTWVLAGVASGLVLGQSAASGAPAANRDPADGLRLLSTKHSLLGTHTWYQQTYRGLPVVGGYLARHTDKAGRVTNVDDGRLKITGKVATRASVPVSTASRAAAASGPAESATLSVLPGGPARLVWSVLTAGPKGTVASVVDAQSGSVLRTRRLAQDDFGTAQVFRPNPVVALNNESLQDRNDANYAALRPAYRTVTLTNLDSSGYLRGDFAQVKAGGQPVAFSRTHRYLYDRTDDRFEAVMSYNDVTTAQRYIQSLGFADVNNESQVLRPNQYPGDNSFYDPAKDSITFGVGGVDDAEDDEVTWHEYGHAIQDAQVPGFGENTSAGSIGEGFGDYWAVTMSEPISPARNLACVADWDSISYTSGPTHCLRRVDEDLTLADRVGEVHYDGQIWSRALYDIHRSLGRVRADRVILEAQFSFSPRTSFGAAARVTVATARQLYGAQAADVAARAFRDRGIG
jgi:Zn-dependent metalloprotease